jgi:hypothetical protein
MKTNLKIHFVSFFILFALCSSLMVRDSQAQWTQVNYNLLGKGISSLAVSGDTIFAGTDHWNGSSYSGIYVSTNNGLNWTQNSLNNVPVYSIVVSGNKIYVATNSWGSSLYLSTNRGINWTNIGFANYISCIAISGNTIFAGVNYDNSGVYLSTNNGTNWIQTALTIRTYSLAVTGSNIIAGTENNGIYYSSNNGISWSQSSFTSGTVRSFLVSGNNVYAGSGMNTRGVVLSTNNGLNWTNIFSSSDDINSLTISGSNIYAGSYNGTFISTNNGTNWNITTLTQYTRALSTLGNVVIAGTQNGYYTTTNNGLIWDSPPPSSIGAIIQSGNNLYGGTGGGVFYSTNGGLRWTFKNLTQNTISFLINGSFLFAGTAGAGVYYTTNDGVNWTQQTSLPNLVVNSLVKKDTYILAATNSNGVYFTTNDGTNWTQSSLNGITTKALYVLDSIVYAGTVFGGVYKSTNNGVNWSQTSLLYMDAISFISSGNRLYTGTGGNGVYYTTNNGANWTQTSLNNNYIYSFSNYGSTIFAGSSNGVYMTKNAGVNWTQVNDGMGNQGVGALCTYGNYEIAGTGSGFWRRYILEFAPIRGDANLDSTVNVLDVTSDVNYILGTPPVPFSTLAADVNTDLVINVLDVVGTVNIILHPTFKQYANKENNDISGSANLYIQNNNLKMFSTMPVKGIQFNLTGAGAQNVTFTPSSVLTNYQVVSGSKSDTARTFIIFTMSDTSLSAGNHTLGTFAGLTGGIAMNQVFISDENGNGILTSGGEYENTEIPKEYSLQQNYPNPFNPLTTIGFQITKSGLTSLKIYDVTSRLIKTLINEFKQAGNYKVEFDAGSVASGVYFYKLTSGDFVSTRKMVVLK